MFSQLWDFLTSVWEHLNPFIIVKDYEEALILRFGKFNRILSSGLHFKCPIIEECIHQFTVITTLNLSAQSLYTKDKQNIVIKSIVKYKVVDIKIFLLEILDSVDCINDISQGVIKNVIMEKTFEECLSPELDNAITKKVRNECKKWGVDVQQVTLSDISPAKTIRLMNDSTSIKLD